MNINGFYFKSSCEDSNNNVIIILNNNREWKIIDQFSRQEIEKCNTMKIWIPLCLFDYLFFNSKSSQGKHLLRYYDLILQNKIKNIIHIIKR